MKELFIVVFILIWLVMFGALIFTIFFNDVNIKYERTEHFEQREVFVTGYNTVKEQTDDTPCISASGANICGRSDVVACPRDIPLGSEVYILGKKYICEDRLSKKYDDRVDVSCDKDMKCPYEITGVYIIEIKK